MGATVIPLFGGCKNYGEYAILKRVEKLQRDYGRVYPFQVATYEYYSEQTLRRKMAAMAERGILHRLGERKGYLAA